MGWSRLAPEKWKHLKALQRGAIRRWDTSPTEKSGKTLGLLQVQVPESLSGAAVSGLSVAQSLLCAVVGWELLGFQLDVELSQWPQCAQRRMQ